MIEVSNFCKYYGERPVLSNVTITVPASQTVVVIGKSGCGKSTLLKHIACLEDHSTGPVEGTIRLFGTLEVTSMKESDIRKHHLRGPLVGLVFQNCALFDSLTVRENILWAARETGRLQPEEEEAKLRDVCDMVEIEPTGKFLDRPVDHLSGGEKKRVALARALILEPRVILYDEPTANLDPPTVAEIIQLINRLKRMKGITSLVATHDMTAARQIADRVAMISEGIKIFEGTFEDAHKDPEIRKFVEAF